MGAAKARCTRASTTAVDTAITDAQTMTLPSEAVRS